MSIPCTKEIDANDRITTQFKWDMGTIQIVKLPVKIPVFLCSGSSFLMLLSQQMGDTVIPSYQLINTVHVNIQVINIFNLFIKLRLRILDFRASTCIPCVSQSQIV